MEDRHAEWEREAAGERKRDSFHKMAISRRIIATKN